MCIVKGRNFFRSRSPPGSAEVNAGQDFDAKPRRAHTQAVRGHVLVLVTDTSLPRLAQHEPPG